MAPEIRNSTRVHKIQPVRKTDNGFPETKELKNRVRNIIEPGRDLGHVDRSLMKAAAAAAAAAAQPIPGPPKVMPGKESGDGGASASTSSTLKVDEVIPDASPTVPVSAQKCQDCQ